VVEFDHVSLRTYFGLKFSLEDLFGCAVDLVIEDTIKPRLRKPILDEVIYTPGF
jgi:uncharacterized protein